MLILGLLMASLPLTAQVLSQSTISVGTNGILGTYGLGVSDWDRIFFPSLAGTIERNFIYVPFNTSNIFTANSFTAGISFMLAPIPFRLFLLGEVKLSSQKWVSEAESNTYSATWYDSDNDAQMTPDKYRYMADNDYAYIQNATSQTGIFLSPGLALNLGPLNLGARYLFKLVDDDKRAFEATALERVIYQEFNVENVSTSLDSEMKITINDSGMINGVGAGVDLSLGDFLALRGDGFFTVQYYGSYNLSATDTNHYLDRDPINVTGSTAPDGSTKDYETSVMTVTVTNGYLSFAGLNQSSAVFTAQTNGRYQYAPTDPSGGIAQAGGTLPASINMPQIVTNFRTQLNPTNSL